MNAKAKSLAKKERQKAEALLWRQTAEKITDTIITMDRIPNGMDDVWRGKMVYHNFDRFKRHCERMPTTCDPCRVACSVRIRPLLEKYKYVMEKK